MVHDFRVAFVSTVAAISLVSQVAIAQPAHYSGQTNYVLHNNCAPIKDLKVTIHATQDIVGPKGLGFQLNATAPTATPYDKAHPDGPPAGAQQYMMGIGPSPAINYAIEIFPLNFNAKSLIFVPSVDIWPMPNVVLPKGYTLTIALADSGDAVVGVDFTVQDNHGYPVAFRDLPMITLPGASQNDFTPVVAFQMNLVGPTGGDVLTQGAGTITYTASTPLTVSSNGYPVDAHGQLCVAAAIVTGENSNVAYSSIAQRRDNTFVQTFNVPPPPMTITYGAGPQSSQPACVAPLKWDDQQQRCSTGGTYTNDQAPPQNPGQPANPQPH